MAVFVSFVPIPSPWWSFSTYSLKSSADVPLSKTMHTAPTILRLTVATKHSSAICRRSSLKSSVSNRIRVRTTERKNFPTSSFVAGRIFTPVSRIRRLRCRFVRLGRRSSSVEHSRRAGACQRANPQPPEAGEIRLTCFDGDASLPRRHLTGITGHSKRVRRHIEAVFLGPERIFGLDAGFFHSEQPHRHDGHQHRRPPAAMIADG